MATDSTIHSKINLICCFGSNDLLDVRCELVWFHFGISVLVEFYEIPEHLLESATTPSSCNYHALSSLKYCSDSLPAADLPAVLTWLLNFNKYCGDCAVVELAMWHFRFCATWQAENKTKIQWNRKESDCVTPLHSSENQPKRRNGSHRHRCAWEWWKLR